MTHLNEAHDTDTSVLKPIYEYSNPQWTITQLLLTYLHYVKELLLHIATNDVSHITLTQTNMTYIRTMMNMHDTFQLCAS